MASPTVEEEEQMNAVAATPAAVNTFADDDEPAGDVAKGCKEMDNQEKRRKKQKEIVMPQREVDYALSFEPMAPYDPEMLASLEAMGLGLDPDLVAFGEKRNSWMLAVQEDYKQQIADKGYVSCMVEVNDDDEQEEEEEDDDYEDDDDSEDEEEPRRFQLSHKTEGQEATNN